MILILFLNNFLILIMFVISRLLIILNSLVFIF